MTDTIRTIEELDPHATFTTSATPQPEVTLESIRRVYDEMVRARNAMPFKGFPVRVFTNPYLPPDWFVAAAGIDGPVWLVWLVWLVQVDDDGRVIRIRQI